MPDPLPAVPKTLLAITLLAMTGGLLDAVIYTSHGQVFANAMTGNLILLGVAVASRHMSEVLRHAVPLAAFVAGVVFGKFLLRRHRSSSLHITLLLQITALAVLGSIPGHVPRDLLVAIVSLTSAVQITTIRRADNVAFNITFMTGNLRAVVEGAFDAVFPPPLAANNSGGARQAGVVGLTCCGFLFGALLGALAGHTLHDRAFWIADVLLLAAGALLYRAVPPAL